MDLPKYSRHHRSVASDKFSTDEGDIWGNTPSGNYNQYPGEVCGGVPEKPAEQPTGQKERTDGQQMKTTAATEISNKNEETAGENFAQTSGTANTEEESGHKQIEVNHEQECPSARRISVNDMLSEDTTTKEKAQTDEPMRSKIDSKIQDKELLDCDDKESWIKSKKQDGTEEHVYKPKLRVAFMDDANSIRKLEFGKENRSKPKKVLMLVGSTGSGKSTMIDAIFNYMFGIQWNDNYRLKLVPDEAEQGQEVNQAESQTQWITAYSIHHQPWFTVPYSLTIIDTPGFGDTGGIKRDQGIMEQIRNFFTTRGPTGIDQLDAVGFVVQSSLSRLTKIQRYIFDSILSIFGRNIADNIFMLLTFADGQKPQVLAGLKEARMEYKHFHKFNNSALFMTGKADVKQDRTYSNDEDVDSEDDEDDEDAFNRMFWKMGENNFTQFMTELQEVVPRSLALTEEVLKERFVLELTMDKIQDNIKTGLRKMEQLKVEYKVLKSHESNIEKNKQFKYEVEELESSVETLPKGEQAVNCSACLITCHKSCSRNFIYECVCFSNPNYTCRYCPGKCSYSQHRFAHFRYVNKIVKYTRTSEHLKQKYEEAKGTKEIIESCIKEFEQVQAATLELTEKARQCLARLDEIALKPNPLSTTDYIDLMIQEEEFMKEPGWKETVEQLKEVKRTAASYQQLIESTNYPLAAKEVNETGKKKPIKCTQV